MTAPTAKDIWQTLSRIDCRDKIENKVGISYLSWVWAWGILMEHYPEARFEFLPERAFADGSVETAVVITIGECQRKMTLPVMDRRKNSITNPSSRQVNDSRMRCLTKCLALFGLGHFIYAGEDLPMSGEPAQPPAPPAVITPEQAASLKRELEETRSDVKAFCKNFRIQSVDELPASVLAAAQKAIAAKRRRMATDAERADKGAAA